MIFLLFYSQILQSLHLGIDLISTNYPEVLSSAGFALALDFAQEIEFKTEIDQREQAKKVDVEGVAEKVEVVDNVVVPVSAFPTTSGKGLGKSCD